MVWLQLVSQPCGQHVALAILTLGGGVPPHKEPLFRVASKQVLMADCTAGSAARLPQLRLRLLAKARHAPGSLGAVGLPCALVVHVTEPVHGQVAVEPQQTGASSEYEACAHCEFEGSAPVACWTRHWLSTFWYCGWIASVVHCVASVCMLLKHWPPVQFAVEQGQLAPAQHCRCTAWTAGDEPEQAPVVGGGALMQVCALWAT